MPEDRTLAQTADAKIRVGYVRVFLFWIMVACAPALADERHYFFNPGSSEQGLSQHTINDLLQDHAGYVWIATQGGLHKYDGYHFTVFRHDADDASSLPDSFITALAEDELHQLWVGGNTGGLARFDPINRTARSLMVPPDAPDAAQHNSITALMADETRGVWIGTAAGIELMDARTYERRDIYRFTPNRTQGNRVLRFTRAPDGTIWCATTSGVLRIEARANIAEPIAIKTIPAALSVLVSADGSVYAGAPDGLFRVDAKTGTAERLWPKPGDERVGRQQVRDIVQDSRGRLWVAVYGYGLLIIDPNHGTSEWLHHDANIAGSLPEEFETRLFIDRSGLMWVGGESHGFATTDPDGTFFNYVFDREALDASTSGNNVRSILEDAQQRLWLGTEGAGLKRFDPSSGKFENFNEPLFQASKDASPTLRVASLQNAGANRLWVATNRGAFLLDPDKHKATAVPIDTRDGNGLPSNQIRQVLVAKDGSLWFGTSGAGLAHWWPPTGSWEFFRHDDYLPDSLALDIVLALHEDRDGRLWIGTLNGLSRYDPHQHVLRSFRNDPRDAHSLVDNVVRIIYQTRDGTLWFGTHGGLDRLDSDAGDHLSFTHYKARDNLLNMTIYGMLEDSSGMLWLSTNRGIARFDREQDAFHVFSPEDGLQGLEFNGGAQWARSNGEFVFGGINGINLFHPEAVTLNHFVPPVVITNVQIGSAANQLEASVDSLAMAQSERVVRFEFAALDYAVPERNRFAYRLEGFDDNWVQAGSRHDATYTNLAAGQYRFRVRASNHDGVWNDQGTALTLDVAPPWWASTAMKLLYALIVATLVLLFWRARQQRKAAERHHHSELQEREDRLRMALWGSGDEFWDWDLRKGTVYRIGAEQMLGGLPERSMRVDEWRDRLHPDDLSFVEQRLTEHEQGRKDFFEAEYRVLDAQDAWMWVHSLGKIVERDDNGQALRICGTARNVTVTRQAERERRISAEVINSMTEAVSVTDMDFNFVSVNHAFTKMTGYTESEVLGGPAALLNCAQHSVQFYQAMRAEFVNAGHWRGELWQKRKDGEEFLCWLEISAVHDADGMRTHYVGVMADITDRKRAEQELRYLANYDTMTGLPNRTLLAERLSQAVIRARRTGRKVAVLFLDLDRFKHVNDSMGHAAGDRVLKATGIRLRANVRESDTVARLGGDEFTVVLEDLRDNEEAERVAQKLMSVFAIPLGLETGQEVVITPSIGISLYPDHGQVPSDLLKFADTAMYQAKERGRNTYMVYTEAMDSDARERANTVTALRKAVERNELSLVYQPKLTLIDNQITGVEALLRWSSEELGEVPPSRFIPLAEEIGIIVEIGEFVIDAACAQLRRWHDLGMHDLNMAVNLSVLQLLRGELPVRLQEILTHHGIGAGRLELEITESMLMANAEQSVRTLTELKEVGVSLAIDDFGTGYSSLSYLKRLPIDTLKIDQTFVGDITTDPDDEAITATIITMAHSLGLNVVAEGVETAGQLEYLREQGCDEIQGHWLSRPMKPDACYDFLYQFEQNRIARPARATR
jgi:diguanylate cyclase (GGDEF)-like protein/PAS domain S-box-containing protein